MYVQPSGNVSRPIPALDAPSSTTITSPGCRKPCIAFQYASWVRGSFEGTKADCLNGAAGSFFVTMPEDESSMDCKAPQHKLPDSSYLQCRRRRNSGGSKKRVACR